MSESMPRLLTFDCSGASCSVAASLGEEIVAEDFAAMTRGQAEALLPMIRATMATAGWDFSVIDAVVTTVGPGSFTGIRIGLSAARGIALAADKPILAFTAFEAVLAGLDADRCRGKTVIVALDSRRGSLFVQRFDAAAQAAQAPLALEPSQFEAWLPAAPVAIAGDGIVHLPESVTSRPGLSLSKTPDVIRAGALARFAVHHRDRARPPEPLYLRLPDVTLPGGAA